MRFLLKSSLIALLSTSCAPAPFEINHNTIDAIAAAVSHPDRIESDRERDVNRHPALVLDFFGIKPGMIVGDMMAGGGYYTEILSRTVGEDGQVYCQNTAIPLRVFADAPLTARLLDNRLANVIRLDTEFEDAGLPTNLDAALLIRFYHDFEWQKVDRKVFNALVFKSLKPGGVFGVVDHHAKAGVKIVAGKPNRRKNRRSTDYENLFNYGPRASVTRSADDGTFVLSAIPDSQGWNVNARHPDFAQTHVVIDAGQIDVWVELEETISLTGVVSDGDGTVLSNTQLWLLTDEGDVSVSSDFEGFYKFSSLRNVDDVYLIAHHPQHGTALMGPVMIAGESQVLNVPLIAGQSVSGTVVDADGKPMANVGVQIKGSLPRDNFSESRLPERFLGIDSSLTNSEGAFVFENLYHNDFQIMVYPAGKPAVLKRGVKIGDALEIRVTE